MCASVAKVESLLAHGAKVPIRGRAIGIDIPGIKQVVFGAVLLLVVIALPEGLWPWIARRLGLAERR